MHRHSLAHVPSAHHAMLQAFKYLPLIAIGVAAVYALTHGHFVLLGLAAAFGLAFVGRLDGLTGPKPGGGPVTLDGGSLSATAARAEREAKAKATVLDGGSMERVRR